MRLILIGAGRAGGALALAAAGSGHEIAGVVRRDGNGRFGPPVALDERMPEADVALICVRDDQVEEIVDSLVGHVGAVSVVAHVSGFLPTTVLNPLQADDVSVGGFHPLQTLPDPDIGAESLRGASVGIGGEGLAKDTLTHLGLSLGMSPFTLTDDVRPMYHAACAAAANYVVTALATATDLYSAAGIDPKVAEELVQQVVRNVFHSGARQSLTGPIARGDTETVVGHLVAAHEVSESVGRQFRLMAEATAILAGRSDEVRDWK